jgi:hypothetical protein
MLDKFQDQLDRINEKFGDVGSVIGLSLWMIVLFFAVEHMIANF